MICGVVPGGDTFVEVLVFAEADALLAALCGLLDGLHAARLQADAFAVSVAHFFLFNTTNLTVIRKIIDEE